jgi:hypothetical protein
VLPTAEGADSGEALVGMLLEERWCRGIVAPALSTVERAIVEVEVERVDSSCGFGAPLMEYVGEREEPVEFVGRKGERKMKAYPAGRSAPPGPDRSGCR